MRVSDACLIYVLIVIIVFILLSICGLKTKLNNVSKLLIAMLIGLLVLLILVPSIAPVTSGERTFYGIFLMFAIIVPIILAIYVVWKGNYLNRIMEHEPELQNGQSKREYLCDGDKCELAKEYRATDKGVETYKYPTNLNGESTTTRNINVSREASTGSRRASSRTAVSERNLR